MGDAFVPPPHRSDLFRLPAGEWIDIYEVSAARVVERADRRTGEIGALAHLCASGSWYTVHFERKDDAHDFVDALVSYRNELHQPSRSASALSRAGAAGMIAELTDRGEANG